MKILLGVAKNKKISDEEIGAVLSIAMTAAAGKVKAQLLEVKKEMQ